ncbi:hypothetical protein [Phenylobacterium sp.]|nr:hypothetical protein [Phenylobacterium sp.]
MKSIEVQRGRPPRAGSRVVIKSAAMGSFLLSVDGQRSIRVRREE